MSLSVKEFLPRTFFGRSLLILVLPVLLIQIVMTIVFFDRHWNRMMSRFAYAASGEIAVLVSAYEGGSDNAQVLSDQFRRYLHFEVGYEGGARLPEAAPQSVFSFWEKMVVKTLRDELSAQIIEPFVLDFNADDKSMTVHIALENGVLSVRFPERRLFSSSGYIFLLWVTGVSGVLLLVSIMFMRNQVRPIRKLAVAAERFGKGQDIPTFRPSGAREVRQAAQAFIDMRRRIQRQISQRTDMLAGISHDLRTPLTRLKLELELLSSTVDVTDMKGDVKEMERMISGYLDFVRGDGDEQYEFVNLSGMFDKLMTGLERQNVKCEVDVPKEINIRVRQLSFERALNNILQNASKYGEHVWVKSFMDDKKLQIQIEDDGPGVDEGMYEEVFKPFKRVDTSRNAQTGGVGLGLSIAMDVVRSHGGDITLDQSTYGGLCVKVRIPV